MAKGAAMIGPRMATMLAFLLTDAPVWPSDLQPILSEAVENTFNCVSVEGHTSTNDTVLLLSSTAATEPILRGDDLTAFAGMVRSACESLARMMADDGEGATHSITIDVEGCESREEARTIARAVADSPLVKTAIHGADPNWGRIVSAAGYAGVPFAGGGAFALDQRDLRLPGRAPPRTSMPRSSPPTSAPTGMSTSAWCFGRGEDAIRFWTCDLTAEYVRLNADYTT